MLTLIPTASHWDANHSSVYWRSQYDEAKRTTSSSVSHHPYVPKPDTLQTLAAPWDPVHEYSELETRHGALMVDSRARPTYRPLFVFFEDIGIGSYAADVSRCLNKCNKQKNIDYLSCTCLFVRCNCYCELQQLTHYFFNKTFRASSNILHSETQFTFSQQYSTIYTTTTL